MEHLLNATQMGNIIAAAMHGMALVVTQLNIVPVKTALTSGSYTGIGENQQERISGGMMEDVVDPISFQMVHLLSVTQTGEPLVAPMENAATNAIPIIPIMPSITGLYIRIGMTLGAKESGDVMKGAEDGISYQMGRQLNATPLDGSNVVLVMIMGIAIRVWIIGIFKTSGNNHKISKSGDMMAGVVITTPSQMARQQNATQMGGIHVVVMHGMEGV